MKKIGLPGLILLVAATLFTGVAAHDAVVPPSSEITTRTLVAAIGQYRRWISPRLEGKIECRFQPTCSAYGLAAVREDGALRGGMRAIRRIARCTPATPKGTVDLP